MHRSTLSSFLHPLMLWAILLGPLAAVESTAFQQKMHKLLTQTVHQQQIPGMIAAISDHRGLRSIAAAGVRKMGSTEKISTDDLVHLGSCTKAMTCALASVLVDLKKIQWDSRLIEVLPELKQRIHHDYHQVRLWDLLSHRAGLPANADNWWLLSKKPLIQRRLELLKVNLKDAPQQKSGEFLYSNLSYMAAGCMLEKVGNASWEDLMQKYVFDDLLMKTAGFGFPGKQSRIDQPWGHHRKNNKADADWVARQFDNAEALGPAGRVHCSVADWAKFIGLQLPKSKQQLLSPQQLKKLRTPDAQHSYAGGWHVLGRPWAKGLALTHSGSNTMWYAIVWVAPEIDRAYIVVSNCAEASSAKYLDKVIGQLIIMDQNR